jgi:hypothetical protein
VDWFEGMAKLGSEVVKLQFFAMRSMGSGDAFHRAYPHATQQALLPPQRRRPVAGDPGWKPTNMRSPTLAASSRLCATTT